MCMCLIGVMYPMQCIMFIQKAIGCQIKRSVPGLGYHKSSCCSEVSQRPMKKIQAIVTAFGFQPELEKPLILEMSHLFVKGYEKKKKNHNIGINQDAPFLLAGAQSIRRCYIDCWVEEKHKQSDPAVNHLN